MLLILHSHKLILAVRFEGKNLKQGVEGINKERGEEKDTIRVICFCNCTSIYATKRVRLVRA